MKAVAQKADALWQLCHKGDQLAAIASCTAPDDADGPIAGVGQRFSKDRSAGQGSKKKASGNKKNVVYCWRHHQFGEKAYSCADPSTCMWAARN
jgi:hypothetical protein